MSRTATTTTTTTTTTVPGTSAPSRTESSDELIQQMREIDKKFRRVCEQLVLLNNRIEAYQKRYDRAVRNNQRSFRYQHRLRLVTLEGVRNMFYEYASNRADKLDEMQDRLMEEHNIDWDDICNTE